MKRLLLLFALVAMTIGAYSQEQGSYDYIFLNNGTVVQGTIVGDASGLSVTIQTMGGEFLTYQKTEINKISRRNPADNLKPGRNTYTEYYRSDKGFWFGFDLYGGVSTNVNKDNGGLGELDFTAGYRFNEYLRVGAGIGARYYIDNGNLRHSSVEWSFPIFANVRGNILPSYERRVVPYYSFSIGGAIRDGVMVRPTIGARFGDLKRSAFLLGLSYLGQDLKAPNGGNKFQSFVTLNIGYEF